MKVHLRFEAELWVTVDLEEEDVVDVIVDAASLSTPVEAITDAGPPDARSITDAARIAESAIWPTWDVRG